MLKIRSLHCQSGKKTLLHIPFLHLSGGNFVAVIGPNGSGKSTLIKSIAGEINYQGNIELHRQDLKQWPRLHRAKHLAVLPQSSQLSFSFSAFEVIALGLTPLNITQSDAKQLIRKKMRATDCLHLSERAFPSLSGGEKQRVQLARVLVQLSQAEQQPLLLLDEPTAAQDLGQQHNILTLCKELCQKQSYTVIAVLHDLNQVMRYCDHCAILNEGVIAEFDTPQTILTTNNISHHWQYSAKAIKTDDDTVVII